MIKPISLLLAIQLVGATFLFAQRTTTNHQTFPISKSISSVIVDIDYPFQIEEWVGNSILIESNIKLKNASRQIMDYLIDTGRYKVVTEKYAGTIKFKLKPMSRKTISTQAGVCEEDILIRFYIPNHLQISTAGRKAVAVN